MALVIIELNDCGIRAARGAEIVVESPGCAIVDANEVIVGQEAAARLHLHPHLAMTRFWQQLDQRSLRKKSKRCRHHADLAFLHLEQIHRLAGKPDETVFAVPGNFTNEQLSLLLGIAQACHIKPAGLVDAAVAAVAAVAVPGPQTHVDIQQHQTVLTRIDVGRHVARVAVDTTDDVGLDKINAACVAELADLFLERCRFDPLHHAQTEQQLYDQLPVCFAGFAQASEIGIAVQYRESRFETRVSRDLLAHTLAPFYAAIKQRIGDVDAVFLTDRLGRLPGIAQGPLADCRILSAESVFEGCQDSILAIRGTGDGVKHVTQLALARASSGARDAPTPSRGAVATHLLRGHRAYALSAAPWHLSAAGQMVRAPEAASVCDVRRSDAGAILHVENGATVLLNGTPATGETLLHPGDQITFKEGASRFTPIAVIDEHAP